MNTNTYTHIYVTTINEKRGNEFERIQRGIWEGLEAKENDAIIL